MAIKQGLLKRVFSWFAVSLGFFVGLISLYVFGSAWIPEIGGTGGWYRHWFGFFGSGIFALAFISGSFVALRNRKHAGTIFLASMPLAAFCLSYPNAGYLLWDETGGNFWAPIHVVAIGLATVFFAPFLVPLLALRHRKRAAYLFVITALVAGVIFYFSYWTRALLPPLAGWSVPFVLFGLFWLGTSKRGWEPLVEPRPRTLSRRVLRGCAVCAMVLFLNVALTLGLTALNSSLWGPDCRARRLFTHSVSPRQAVFTARLLFVGRSMGSLNCHSGVDDHSTKIPDPRMGDWAIGIVQEKFWGLPSWTPRLVLLTNAIYWKGETYFIDGKRANGLLTRLLPIVEVGVCTRTRPVKDALVDLRVLRNPPSPNGAHIIGYVEKPALFVGGWTPPVAPNPFVDATINLIGANGKRTVYTDQSGIYEFDGLAPGDYTLQMLVPNNQLVGLWDENSEFKFHLEARDVVEGNFELFWNGRIEGRVVDDSGMPAHTWVQLQPADGSQVPGNVNTFLMTNKDGSFQINKIPPGRYRVMLNPMGPENEWPFDPQYYPSAVKATDAQVLTLTEGQQIKGINFKAPRLAERSLEVRVKWPDGKPAVGVPVSTTYEHTSDYDLQRGGRDSYTGQDGTAFIHLYGISRVRLYAAQTVYTGKKQEYQSSRVELGADKMPDKVDLVLNAPKQ